MWLPPRSHCVAGATFLGSLCVLLALSRYRYGRVVPAKGASARHGHEFAHYVPGPDDCTDRKPQCVDWKQNGQCEKNPKFMRTFCALSCAHCVAPPLAHSFYPEWRTKAMSEAERMVQLYTKQHARNIMEVTGEFSDATLAVVCGRELPA